MRGIGNYERKPSKLDEGFLSIEKLKSDTSDQAPHFLAYRNYLGKTHFSSVINKKLAKIKEINEKANRYKVKIAVAVKDLETSKYEAEYVIIKFITENDR